MLHSRWYVSSFETVRTHEDPTKCELLVGWLPIDGQLCTEAPFSRVLQLSVPSSLGRSLLPFCYSLFFFIIPSQPPLQLLKKSTKIKKIAMFSFSNYKKNSILFYKSNQLM